MMYSKNREASVLDDSLIRWIGIIAPDHAKKKAWILDLTIGFQDLLEHVNWEKHVVTVPYSTASGPTAWKDTKCKLSA